jgi:HSP20 family molecular chaperone IbpA
MSPNNNNDDRSDDAGDNPSMQSMSLIDQLRTLLETLAEIEEEEAGHRQGSGQIDRGTTRIDYNYDVSVGLGRDDRVPHSESSSPQSHSESQPSFPGATEDGIHIETREGRSDDELIVIADLPRVTDEDVAVDLDTNESALILRINENEVKRIPLDQSDMKITDMTIKNQILELRVSRASDSNGGKTT